jgi:N-acetylglutamate synthase-like GNAT family acetyltransferase
MPQVRKATENDIPGILELYLQLSLDETEVVKRAKEQASENHRQAFALIENLPGCELIIAEERGKLIGTAMLMIVPTLAHNGSPWTQVEMVVVDREYRRTGVGRLLMDYIREKAEEAGCYKIQLSSNKVREDAHKFYQSIGYGAVAEGFRLYL